MVGKRVIPRPLWRGGNDRSIPEVTRHRRAVRAGWRDDVAVRCAGTGRPPLPAEERLADGRQRENPSVTTAFLGATPAILGQSRMTATPSTGRRYRTQTPTITPARPRAPPRARAAARP